MEYYQAAARWWADIVRNVKPDYFSVVEEESELRRAIMETRLSKAIEATPTDEMIDRFEMRLSEHIRDWGKRCKVMRISVGDYTDSNLKMIAEETGISLDRFPSKITMWIEKGNVSASIGVPVPTEIVFPVD